MPSRRGEGQLYLTLVVVVVVAIVVVVVVVVVSAAPNVFCFVTRDVPRSPPARGTGHINRLFVIFSSTSWQVPQQRIKFGIDRFIPHSFQFVAHSASYHFTLHSLNCVYFSLQSSVVTVRTASLTFNNSTFCPHSVFVWI